MQIAIAGAGIMGRMLAWHLLRAGHRPVLYDRDPVESGGAAAYTAAGMLAPYCELESAEELIYRMGLEGLRRWADLAGDLEVDVGFRSRGSVVVAHRQDRADLQRFQRILEARLGRESPEDCRRLDRDGLESQEPSLAGRFGEGLFLSREAWVDNLRVMAVLAERLRQAGVAWHTGTEVTSLAPGRLRADGREARFDWVVDCRGMGAARDMTGLRGVRGELLQVHAPDVDISHMVRLMHPRYRLYLVPGRDRHYILGATQIESEDYSPVSVRSALELLSALYSLHDGFAEARISAARVNCRPALADNLPVVAAGSGLVRINGLFRHGFLLAPVLAGQVTALLEAPERFEPAWPAIHRTIA